MKRMSIRAKITLWFSLVMVCVVAVSFVSILWADYAVIQKMVQDNLIQTLEDNVDEVEFFKNAEDPEHDYDADQYISYGGGYLEIDDDFLDRVNGITTALYTEDGQLLYGENPIAQALGGTAFSDRGLQKLEVQGVQYYVFDCRLEGNGVDALWLRGVVSEDQGTEQFGSVVRLAAAILPILLLLAVVGGYVLAYRAMRPVKEITKAAEQISRGRDLKRRIELGTGNDELHQLADVFNEMFGRLDQAFQAEQQFTADASHELRTPVAVIMAQCEYTLEEPRTAEEYEESLTVIRRQGGKMKRLIEDMLCFARMEQNSEKAAREPLDFSKLADDICTDLVLLKTKGIALSWEIEPEIMLVGNRLLLTRMISNLINNAYRYGRENGSIAVSVKREGQIVLTVRDDGIGIAPEEQEKIFERFYRADASRSTEGTGLGLAMVREIAEFHGGSVTVASEPGVGSTFTIFLPDSPPQFG